MGEIEETVVNKIRGVLRREADNVPDGRRRGKTTVDAKRGRMLAVLFVCFGFLLGFGGFFWSLVVGRRNEMS